MGGRGSLGITESIVDCGTVGVMEVVKRAVGITELVGDSRTVMSAGVSMEVNGSAGCGDSGTVMSAGVSLEVDGSTDCLSLVSMLWLDR